MDIITFFGEETYCIHERNHLNEWYGDDYLPLPSQLCMKYCGEYDYPGERLPLFEDLLRVASLRLSQRRLSGNTQVTSSILNVRDVDFLNMLSCSCNCDIYVKYVGSPIYNRKHNVLLMKLLREPFTHVKEYR